MAEVQQLADKSFALVKHDSRHPAVRMKRVGPFHSAQIGLYYRALGIAVEGGVPWFWSGSHAEYDKLVG